MRDSPSFLTFMLGIRSSQANLGHRVVPDFHVQFPQRLRADDGDQQTPARVMR